MEKPAPKYREHAQPVKDTLYHIDNKLERLHHQCQHRGLSEEAEAALRADLEAEKALLIALPPDSPYLDALTLQAAHLATSDARADIMLGETQDLNLLRSHELANAWLGSVGLRESK